MLLTLLCCLAACQHAPQADTALNTPAPDAVGGQSSVALATIDGAERLDALGAITPAQTLTSANVIAFPGMDVLEASVNALRGESLIDAILRAAA